MPANLDNMPKIYLGNGVYAYHDGSGIWIYANDHRERLATKKIYLRPEVLEALNKFNEQVVKTKGE